MVRFFAALRMTRLFRCPQALPDVPGGVPDGFIVHEVQGVLIPEELQVRGEILVGVPELQAHRQKGKQGHTKGHVPFPLFHAAETLAGMAEGGRVLIKVSGGTVQTVESKALLKLRNPARSAKLKEFY